MDGSSQSPDTFLRFLFVGTVIELTSVPTGSCPGAPAEWMSVVEVIGCAAMSMLDGLE